MDDLAPQPPEKPLPMDCCDGGCDRCVFDIYAEELEHYQRELAAWRERQQRGEAGQAEAAGEGRGQQGSSRG